MHPLLRILGILAVFLVAAGAWLVLGGVTSSRTTDQGNALHGRVADLWGRAQRQEAPAFFLEWDETVARTEEVTDAAGRVAQKTVWETVRRSQRVEPVRTRVDARLDLDQRRKGLLWFPLYDVAFSGAWTVTHAGPPRDLRVVFAFPDAQGAYDDFRFVVDGADLGRTLRPEGGAVQTVMAVAPGQSVDLEVGYRSRGLGEWRYQPSPEVGQVEDFQLVLHTDFPTIDFPELTMSPSARSPEGEGWRLEWSFARLVTGYGMGMVLPVPVQPGELAAGLAFSAPISLGLFFVWIYVLGLLRGLEIHPVNHLFIAAAFFSFNLLFAYTADHLPVEAAFALASAVSVGLVVSYLRLVVGPRFAFLEAGVAQLLYQVGFGVAHFHDGYTGLTVTVLGVVTLFALMQLTGRIQWSRALSAPVRA